MHIIKKYGLILILAFYAFLHIAQLEVYPFYHFAMYSQRIYPKVNFHVYEIKVDNEPVDLSKLNYRKYVYLTNTIKVYEVMDVNQGCHPSAEIINKYYTLLGMESLAGRMRNENYCQSELRLKTTNWLIRFFKNSGDISIYKIHYNWPHDGAVSKTRQERIL